MACAVYMCVCRATRQISAGNLSRLAGETFSSQTKQPKMAAINWRWGLINLDVFVSWPNMSDLV
jgi:hypothetical protein